MRRIERPDGWKKFKSQRGRAKNRGIAWDLTFEEWLKIWIDSGKMHLRGRGAGTYVMARIGDKGPYSVENVFICTNAQNVSDAAINRPDVMGSAGKIGTGKGWCLIDRGGRGMMYRATFKGKFLGDFQTKEESIEAYKKAFEQYQQEKE
ncbi:hypothetical protein [Burkholderia sp. BCC0405]|uniref:hypothetical protein n=1 Tax=Burkholderia sp. BCC0405 TaxID=2676298 RepID=UPI00158B9B2C|nr:hypothetical protein [Burkholderia sp. BCC0405]